MLLELCCFLGSALILILPGILLATRFRLGKTVFDRATYGSSLGLGLAVYLASLISHFNLKWFYPLWAIVAAAALLAFLFAPKRAAEKSSIQGWMIVILLLVGISRFAAALPHELPRGEFDPSFHMILAKKIQLTQHAIFDWSPFEPAKLNYPTGSHTLIVVLSAISRLPLQTIFKDLIPLLGIITTAQIFVLAKKSVQDDIAALCAAAAYGLWAVGGSINYYNWGGLPNELGMLFLISMLSLWLDDSPLRPRAAAMALLFAAMILSHHHVMVAGGAILAVAILWQMIHPTPQTSWKLLLLTALAGAAMDGFFLLPYIGRLATLHSTHVLNSGEPPVTWASLADSLGYVFGLFAACGVIFWLASHKPKIHPLIPCACAAMLGLFFLCEYLWPIILKLRRQPPSNAFTPSRFLADMNYFLAIFAGLMMARIFQQRLHMKKIWMIVVIALAGLTVYPQWKEQSTPVDVPDGFIRACQWINTNTSASTIVLNQDVWTSYFAWRRAGHTPMPISEPLQDTHPQVYRVPLIESGKIPPDAPDQKVVEIIRAKDYAGQPILWQDDTGILVIQLWPRPPF